MNATAADEAPTFDIGIGWLLWEGGNCPVPPSTTVDYIDRGRVNAFWTARAGDLVWGHGGGSGYITSYRLSVYGQRDE